VDRRIARLAVGPVMAAAALLVVAGPMWSHPAFAYGPSSTTSTTSTTAPVTTTTTVAPTSTTTIAPGSAAIAESKIVTTPGGSLIVSGRGFHPLETITIVIHSVGVLIGTTTSTSTGTFSTVVAIPSYLPTGEHVITATDTSGFSLSEDIALVDSTTGTTGTTGTGAGGSTAGSGGSGSLPDTGTDIALTVGGGSAAIALGGLLVLGVRRRRSGWAA
jgi:LPXTG-motif cell wall-anchored protein